jgi:hypothetical protein
MKPTSKSPQTAKAISTGGSATNYWLQSGYFNLNFGSKNFGLSQ